MAISEAQLETWSHIGSQVQSAATYQAIRGLLKDKSAPFAGRGFDVHLQGSYGNDTNVYSESDVDVVICLTDAFNSDIGQLDAADTLIYGANKGGGVAYGFDEFKADVLAWLTKNYGTGVKAGKKAIFVPGNNGRRDADVLVCVEHRRYTRYRSIFDNSYHTGICFWTTDNKKIINFPKQHMENCTTKHQATSNRFKPSVRVVKNMRNAMVDAHYIGDGVAPSYFLEGMLWNVPTQNFSWTFQQTFENCLAWLDGCNPTKLACANDLHWLIRDGANVCWNMADFHTTMAALRLYWNTSGR